MQDSHQKIETGVKVVLVLIWLTFIGVVFHFRDRITVETLMAYQPKNLFLAAMGMVGVFALKGVSIVIYSGLLYTVTGLLFPAPLAILVNILGSFAMVSIPYWIGRKTGNGTAQYIVAKYPKAAAIQKLRSDNDFLFGFLVRIVGHLPSDIVSVYMGAIGMPYGAYIAGSMMGMLPHMITFPLLGGSIRDWHAPVFWVALCGEAVYVAGSVLLCRNYQKRHSA